MMGATDNRDEEPIPLLQLGLASPPPMAVDDLFNSDETVNFSDHKRTGNTWTVSAHIITGVIGSGVLSLAWSMARLGWIWGPLLMLLFAAVTLFSSFLICNCYRFPDPDYGPTKNTSYIAAVQCYLGKKNAWICGVLIQMNLYGTGVAYTITTALGLSMFYMFIIYILIENLKPEKLLILNIYLRAVERSKCDKDNGSDAPCDSGNGWYMLLFGLVQIFMSQIPDFHSMEWVSIAAAIMSFAYSSIALGLGAAKVVGNRAIQGSLVGVSTSTAMQKVWRVSQAVGDIAFAYPYTMIVLEIQDTLKSPPSERKTMKKASAFSICITTFFYLSCGGFGYAAFGEHTPGDLLTGFGDFGPRWLINFANTCVVLHLIGGYQVYSQPLFAMVDKWMADQFPRSSFVATNHIVKLPLLPPFSINVQRLVFRTAYVVSTTGVAMIFPYFNQVLGMLGTINFWPLSIYFPVEMWLRQNKVSPWSRMWTILKSFSVVCFFVNMYIFAGSLQGILAARVS